MKTNEELLASYHEIDKIQSDFSKLKDDLRKKCHDGIVDIFEQKGITYYDLIGNDIRVSTNLNGDDLIEEIKLDSDKELHFYFDDCDYFSESLGGEILYWVYTLLYEQLFQ